MNLENSELSNVCLYCCETCNADSLAFADKQNSIKEALRLAGLEDKIAVIPINCLGACKHAQTVAIRGTNSAAFLFGPVKFPEDIPDIISTCRVYLETPDGWIEDSRDCGNLRHCLIGRIPG